MIIQSTPVIIRQRNQVNRECLYAWYPEAVPSSQKPPVSRDIYIYKGIDKDLIQQDSQKQKLINRRNNNNDNNSNDELMQRYAKSIAPSEPIYHSTETLDEALTTPWALHYEVKRRPASPNFSLQSTDTTCEEIPRRLKSAPVARPQPLTSILTIPEPRFVSPLIPVTAPEVPRTPLISIPKQRAVSAKARLSTSLPTSNEQSDDNIKQQRREIKSAQGIRQSDEMKLSNEEDQNNLTQVILDTTLQQQRQSAVVPSTPPPRPLTPANVQSRPASSSSNRLLSATIDQKSSIRLKPEIKPVPLNPHYVHRPGVIAINNASKSAIIQENPESKKTDKSHRHHYHRHHRHHHRERRQEPLLALTPILQTANAPTEVNGIKLIYDPKLTLDDPSLNMTKYYIEGRLYLIKDQHYNVIENVDPKLIEKYNQNSTLAPRPKYYQTIPVEKFDVPKPPPEVHYNASETYFYNTLPKRAHRYVIDPNFISENLNISGRSMSKRTAAATTATATVRQPTINDFNRQPTVPTTVYI